MTAATRRTQAERREATIGSLLDATISILAENGYAGLTVAEVCARAEFSQGALFRHFPSRHALIAAATEEVCRRHHALLAGGLERLQTSPEGALDTLVRSLRNAARTEEHAAWHEVMVAARTDLELRLLVAPTLERFEQSLLDAIGRLGAKPEQAMRLGTIILSVMHMLDSEAVTVAVYDNPPLIADRTEWLVDFLGRELARCLT